MGRDHGHPYILSTTVLSDIILAHENKRVMDIISCVVPG